MKELSPPNLNLTRLFDEESECAEPILFILSPGADPSQELEDLAKAKVGLEKYHQVRISAAEFSNTLDELRSDSSLIL